MSQGCKMILEEDTGVFQENRTKDITKLKNSRYQVSVVTVSTCEINILRHYMLVTLN